MPAFLPQQKWLKDVLIEDGKILKIGKIKAEDCQIIDCKGKIVCPMFVDGHEHLLGNYWDEEGLIFKSELEQAFPNIPVALVDPLSLSVSCHIGPGTVAATLSVNNYATEILKDYKI